MIELAPIQGFTDFVYRKVYDQTFSGVDTFFIPYISVKNGEILKKHQKEIAPENNTKKNVIAQILAKDRHEMLFLAEKLRNLGYREINLNLGCPYPMVTNRGKGAGLLPYPEKVHQILSVFFENSDLKLSVKLRTGLISENEQEKIIPVLNEFPLTEVILHARIAKQLYKGNISETAFKFAANGLKHTVVYNGDIFSLSDFKQKKEKFPEITTWMLGRGVLMNPFLPAEIKGIQFSDIEKQEKLKIFHQQIFEEYSKQMDNPGNTLNKMKQFWSYFCFNFTNPQKVFKQIKKLNKPINYTAEISKIFVRI